VDDDEPPPESPPESPPDEDEDDQPPPFHWARAGLRAAVGIGGWVAGAQAIAPEAGIARCL